MNGTAGIADPVLIASGNALSWLRDAAWPLWLEHGVDWARRGFNESLELETLRSPAAFRRLRVVSRQVFVFSEAHAAGLPRAAEAVELGIAFLREKAREADGGYAQHFDLDGRIIEPRRDLYDHAFVLLALASAARLLPKEPLRREALALLRYLDTRFPHPRGGYVESLPPALPRRQNPHMHLLEAFLAAAAAFGEEIFLTRAGDMVRLFLERFHDASTGTLPEFFDEALLPQREGGRHIVEPGHHCEWVWLLGWYRKAAQGRGVVPAQDLAEAGRGLLAFVDRHGVNAELGTAFDELWSDGALKHPGSRLWPQTERLKAEVLRPDATPDGMARAYAALRPYLDASPRGLWFERLDQQGRPSTEPAPASSLYHLTAGILVAHRHLAGASRTA
ncbi:AGE family epimerase/isomerase [Roseomonas xinghualingensis]|uniref:AGE family epimerase/isomerase n=1 Tax=Roseomonas xinghualingensis TaxID=2986475 RepID=UPI0021F1B41B|nr:AGE family epimerase/isomerase [Roseomonas sp. SXEYE001]MCV4206503.1 AGE family epimerase/isomerase [Roseomonas sp. SXEYE001]